MDRARIWKEASEGLSDVLEEFLKHYSKDCFKPIAIEEVASELDKVPGLYFFEMKYLPKANDTKGEKWKEAFRKKWEAAIEKATPKVSTSRLEKLTLESVESWVPLYIGKSANLAHRIKQHFELNANSTTSSLKLNARKNFATSDIRVKFFCMNADPDTAHLDILLTALESKFRDELKPIVGKQ